MSAGPASPLPGRLLAVAAGGAMGAICRYGLTLVFHRLPPPIPYGTLTANIVGCFLIGFLASLAVGPWVGREELRLLVMVGFLGGLTTFSALGYEVVSLSANGQRGPAVGYLVLTNGVGLLAVWLGYRLAVRVGS